MPTLAVTAIGADQPGIVAAVTGVLVERGCNLEDTSMSILRGHFAMVLIVAGAGDADARALEEALAEATTELDLVVTVREVAEVAGGEGEEGEAWTVVVYGADHPGIVHGVASALAGLGVNIVDLTTRVTGDDRPVYAMVMEVTIPARVTPAALESCLAAESARLGVDYSLHPSEADIL
ncbi:MAG TPA: ACT domain-containing protein [Acidimicrobiales bacterium]|nr:ACT domain-containing protein [Acidimicrobiales bacterium]